MELYRRYLGIVLIAWLPLAVLGWAWAWANAPFVAFGLLLAIVVATLPPLVGTHWLVVGPLRRARRRRLVDLVAAAAVSVVWTAGLFALALAASIFSPETPMTADRFVTGVAVFGAATTLIVERCLRLTTRRVDTMGVVAPG